MSKEKIEKILATYEPVEGMPGYVWINKNDNTIVSIDILREVYEEQFSKGAGEKGKFSNT